MKIKNFNKQFSLKSINTTGNIDKIELTSMYTGPPFAIASRQIENGLLDCKELLDSKMFYNISNSTNTTTTTKNNTTNNNSNNVSYIPSGSKYECYHSLLSNEDQVYNNNNLKSLPRRKFLSKQYKSIDVMMKPSSITDYDDITIKTSNKSVAFIECDNYKLDTMETIHNEPEYIQIKNKIKNKTKSIIDNLLHNRSLTCCKPNMNYNLCTNLSDYIHANNRRKQIVIIIIVLSILLLIIIIITMVILYKLYDESPTSSYSLSPTSSPLSSPTTSSSLQLSSELLNLEPLHSTLSSLNRIPTYNQQLNISKILSTNHSNINNSSSNNSSINISSIDQKCKTQKFCLNISCLQIASILAERLGRYNRPKMITNLLNNQCTIEHIDQLIKIFYIGDEFHLSTNDNSLYKFKQKRLSTLWLYISNELQNYIIDNKKRSSFIWTEKLAYLFQHLIDQSIFKKNMTNINTTTILVDDHDDRRRTDGIYTVNKSFSENSSLINSLIQYNTSRIPRPILINKETYSSLTNSTMKMIQSNEFEIYNLSYKTELEQLNDLLQLGNIAFHGLDTVLINVQLNLRVPLFFSAWIERSHTPGLMDSLIPMLDNCEQPELPTYEELKDYVTDKSKSFVTSSSSKLFNTSPLDYSASSSSSSTPFLWNRVHELRNYIHHLGQLAWKARYSSIADQHFSDGSSKYLNFSGVLPVLYKLQKLNYHSEINRTNAEKITIRELMQITQHTINFPRYLGKLTSRNHLTIMPSDMQVWVTNIDYYDKLGRLLQQTSFSELQDYITFAILHKYGGYVDQKTAQLKNKFLKPYAESLGIDQVSYWPFLLDLASPGLQQILQSRWTSIQLNYAIKQFHHEILTPVQTIMIKLLDRSLSETTKCYQLLNKISSIKIQLTSHNGHDSMEDFYSELKIQSRQSLLMQLVQFNNFLSQKAISTELSKLIPDLGLSSGGSKLFHYIQSSNILEISLLLLQWPYFMPDLSIPRYLNFGYLWYSVTKILSSLFINNRCLDVSIFYQSEQDEFDLYVRKFLLDSKFIDQWLIWSKTPNVFQSILAIEITGRIYKDYLSIHYNQPDSNLPGIFLTNKELFYQWIFQLICPGFDYANTITHNNVLLHSIKECDVIRTALKLSPTFRWFMECP
ncbi:unnamed protein product [Schistosoma rodhaini]|uniref:Peptidase M13 N-terminal domain-containing protein n=1 Tax=Schistosoma rodhaini TaxID=6188 RepID=A0AA85FN99_9TREM|nr:unnamed protein product [Schistosoma rodhaini]